VNLNGWTNFSFNPDNRSFYAPSLEVGNFSFLISAIDSQNYSANTTLNIVVYQENSDMKKMLSTIVYLVIVFCVVLLALVFVNTISIYYKVKNTREVDNDKLKKIMKHNPTRFRDRI